MSDLWQELPLFGRPRVDETGVGDGWEADLAAVRAAADAALATHPDVAAADAFAAAFPAPRLDRRGRAKPVKLAELDRAVYAYLELCARVGAPPAVPARAGGAVALGRAASAPTEIRAVISGHALHATDAEWTFGRGPVLEDTAAALLEFLGGRSLRAPHPPTPEHRADGPKG